MYNIGLDLNKDFERTLDSLRIKYGEDFEILNGVHQSQLDYSEFLNKFIANNTLADSTIDPNANANHRDIRSFITEKGKPSDKLFGLNYVFKRMKKEWGIRTAKEWLEQEYTKGFYLNDAWSVSLFPYCWANDLTKLAREGLFFLNNYNNPFFSIISKVIINIACDHVRPITQEGFIVLLSTCSPKSPTFDAEFTTNQKHSKAFLVSFTCI